MKVFVNGEEKIFDENSSLEYIIINLGIKDKVMAATVNMNIVKKDDWGNFILKDNDNIELLNFVSGG